MRKKKVFSKIYNTFFFIEGVVPPNMFDQLQTASFIGGFHASIRGTMPAMSHYISTGKEPFVAVYTSLEVGNCGTENLGFVREGNPAKLKEWGR